MVGFTRMVAAHRDNLPHKSKKNAGYPTFVWIEPPLHDNFDNNPLHAKFNKALNNVTQFHENVYALKLKKIWDEHDGNAYLKREEIHSCWT